MLREFCQETQLEIVLDKKNMIELVSSEGKAMKVLGITKLTIQAPEGGWTTAVLGSLIHI